LRSFFGGSPWYFNTNDRAIVTHGGGPLVTGEVHLTTGMNASWSALRALNVIIGLFSSLAVNMPDFGRFSKYENAGYSQFIFLPLLGTLGALAPIFVTSAAQYLWGEYIWFMPAVIAKFDNRAAMVHQI
jgi:cytosine/uracil/thiamine/allantoin permease